jgi:hypothetical protein
MHVCGTSTERYIVYTLGPQYTYIRMVLSASLPNQTQSPDKMVAESNTQPKLTKQEWQHLHMLFVDMATKLSQQKLIDLFSDPKATPKEIGKSILGMALKLSLEIEDRNTQAYTQEVLAKYNPEHLANRFTDWVRNSPPAELAQLHATLLAMKKAKVNKRHTKHKFTKANHLNVQNPKEQDRKAAFLAKIPRRTVTALKNPYPPIGMWAAETQQHFVHWEEYLKTCRLADNRGETKRKPTIQIDMSKLNIVNPNESVTFTDGKNQVVALVLRNWVSNPKLVEQADQVCKQYCQYGISIRVSAVSQFVVFWWLIFSFLSRKMIKGQYFQSAGRQGRDTKWHLVGELW